MPGPSPAGPTPPTVINLCARRREAPMPHHGTPRSDGPPETPEAILAETIQSLYRTRGQSLNDPDTAAAFDTACEAFERMVDAVHASGPMDADTHAALRHMVTAARRVPDLL